MTVGGPCGAGCGDRHRDFFGLIWPNKFWLLVTVLPPTASQAMDGILGVVRP